MISARINYIKLQMREIVLNLYHYVNWCSPEGATRQSQLRVQERCVLAPKFKALFIFVNIKLVQKANKTKKTGIRPICDNCHHACCSARQGKAPRSEDALVARLPRRAGRAAAAES